MKTVNKQVAKSGVALAKQRSYQEVVEFLNAHWQTLSDEVSLAYAKQLDKAFDNVFQKTSVAVVAGTNGKSLTLQFASQLLKEENLKVGAFYSPHLLTYNERMVIGGEQVSNKLFTDVANEVIAVAESLTAKPSTAEILLTMALVYFNKTNVDVVLLEADAPFTAAIQLAAPKIVAITRITPDKGDKSPEVVQAAIDNCLKMVQKGAHVVSADQSKLNLKVMADRVEEKGATWSMPIRKLVALAYPFEQLHGRCAALAERIAHIYVNAVVSKESTLLADTLLTKQKGQRGRPTLEAKRQSELHPKRTIEQFWKDVSNGLPGRFQILDKEKPTILLDTANNLDAFENLLLGIRLLHYSRPLKGLSVIVGCDNPDLDITEFLKLLRYFFKKTSGHITICPVNSAPWSGSRAAAWDTEAITNDIKGMKIKARASASFKDAFETAQKSVDERQGLIVIAGAPAFIAEYWNYKDIKKI